MSSAWGEETPVIAVVSKGICRPRFFKAAAYSRHLLSSVLRQNLAAGAHGAVYAVYAASAVSAAASSKFSFRS